MKNKKMWLGILFSLILIFGKTGIVNAQSGGGTFILTDIPARFNDKFVLLVGFNQRDFLLGTLSHNLNTDTGTLPRIVNGRVSIPMWILIDDGLTEEIVRYNGNHTVEVEIIIFDSATLDWSVDEIAWILFESVSFSNGNATVSFQDNDEFGVD
jgi:hypothetical protein